MSNILREYKKRRDTYQNQVEKLTRKGNLLGNIRLLVIFIGIGGTVWFYLQKSLIGSFNTLLMTLVVFIYLIFKHNQINTLKKKAKVLLDINIKGIKRLKGEWKEFEETGEVFINEDHNFSWDLDLFGKHSLYQWMNNTNTPIGKEKLKDAMIKPDKTIDVIKERQKAVEELASKTDWVQEFQATGIMETKNMNNPNELLEWSRKINRRYLNKGVNLVAKILPAVTAASIVSVFLFPSFSYIFAVIPIIFQVILAVIGIDQRSKIMSSVGKYRNDIKTYEQLIKLFEEEKFSSDYIRHLQKKIKSKSEETVTNQVNKLDRIMDGINMRYMQFYIVFDILTLWDYQCVIALEKWKDVYGKYLSQWLEAIGNMEALSSIGTVTYEQPDWVMPEIIKERKISGYNLGHPLIDPEERVCNDINFGGRKNALLITGSNMSGKSTFLRTIGINMVLAYAGAPVCAEKFHCPLMDIYTSMRVKDDLDNKISSFYAELIRIKRIVKAADENKEIFFLLDEIFKGTNSRDRHIGAKTLIRTLSRQKTLGLVSTHDLELADLSKESGSRIENYHFKEHYKDDEIYFDYTLYPGVSTTFNAIYLMKQIGIDIRDRDNYKKE